MLDDQIVCDTPHSNKFILEGSINDDSFEAEYITFCLNIIYYLDMTIFNKYNTLFGKKKFCSKKSKCALFD